jgi:glycerol 2-dehydrogenase (NADP+)
MLIWYVPLGCTRRFRGVIYSTQYLIHLPQTVEYPSNSAVSLDISVLNEHLTDGYDAPTDFGEIIKDLKIVESPTFNETWTELERLHASGRARAIGVSNFSIKT